MAGGVRSSAIAVMLNAMGGNNCGNFIQRARELDFHTEKGFD